MSEEKNRVLSQAITVSIAVVPILVGLFQYNATRREEFRKRFWEEQIALYRDASQAASEIAMSDSLASSASARLRFWCLYWGKLSMVEHKEVERAMMAFGKQLGACEKSKSDACFGPVDGSVSTELRRRAYALAHCAGYSLTRTWNPAGITIADSREICLSALNQE